MLEFSFIISSKRPMILILEFNYKVSLMQFLSTKEHVNRTKNYNKNGVANANFLAHSVMFILTQTYVRQHTNTCLFYFRVAK